MYNIAKNSERLLGEKTMNNLPREQQQPQNAGNKVKGG